MITSVGVRACVLLGLGLHQLLVSQLEMRACRPAICWPARSVVLAAGVGAVYGPAWRASSISPATPPAYLSRHLSDMLLCMPTVLIIDDNAAVAIALDVLFLLPRSTPVRAASPEEGLQLLDSHAIDLVVQDMNFTADTTSGEEWRRAFHAIRAR